MVDASRSGDIRRDSARTNGSTKPDGQNGRSAAVASSIIGRPIRVIVAVEPADERAALLRALARFQGIDVHAPESPDFQAMIAARTYDYAIVWYHALEKLRDTDATALVRLSRNAKIIVALTSDRMLDAAKVLHLADAWLFTDGPLERLGLLVGLSDSGYTVMPSSMGNDFGLDGLRGQLLDALQQPERRVLDALGRGSTNRDIAVELGMSEPQTKAVVRSILGKMRFRNRTEAAVFMARRRGRDGEALQRRAS